MQIPERRHIRLAKYGCLRCGRFLFAPTWYKLYYNVIVCNCDASHFKASGAYVPDHIQAYWDAQFSTMSHSTYRRRLKRWTKRYLPGELLYDEAFSIQPSSPIPNLVANDLNIKEALNVLSGRKLRAGLKSRFSYVHTARTPRPGHFLKNFLNFTKFRHVVSKRYADNDAKLVVENYPEARP